MSPVTATTTAGERVIYARPVGRALAGRTEAPPVPIPRTLAVWLVLRLARLCVGGYEVGLNDGPLVRVIDRVSGVEPGGAWCAAFVSFCCAIVGATYPLTPTGSCPDLAAEAKRLGILARDPEPGDVVLYWHAVPHENAERFAHTGLVLGVDSKAGTIEAIEGNTNANGEREGWQVCRKVRRLKERDAVVHWHHLIPTCEHPT